MSKRPFRESRRQRQKRREAEQRFRNKWFSASRELMQKIKASQQRLNKLKQEVNEYKEKHGIHYELPAIEKQAVPTIKRQKRKKERIHGSFGKPSKTNKEMT